MNIPWLLWPLLVQSRRPAKVKEELYESEDPYQEFSAGILNFHAHYCQDDHSSSWYYHDKVYT